MHDFGDEFLQDAILEKLQRLTGTEFEEFLASFYMAQGYLVDRVGGAGDNGIDLIIEPSDLKFVAAASGVKSAVQCKRCDADGSVTPATVHEFIGALWSKGAKEGVKKGYLITTSECSDNARACANEAPIRVELISGVELAHMIMKQWKQEIREEIWEEVAEAGAEEEEAEADRIDSDAIQTLVLPPFAPGWNL